MNKCPFCFESYTMESGHTCANAKLAEENGVNHVYSKDGLGCLTKREYFAGQALVGLCQEGFTPIDAAAYAVASADALLLELEKK